MSARLGTALAAVAALSGCGALPDVGGTLSRLNPLGSPAEVEGLRFRSRLRETTADDRGFVVTTRGARRNVRAALEAARIEAFDHCLTRFGGTEVAWTLSPDRGPEAVTLDERGRLQVAGTCIAR